MVVWRHGEEREPVSGGRHSRRGLRAVSVCVCVFIFIFHVSYACARLKRKRCDGEPGDNVDAMSRKA